MPIFAMQSYPAVKVAKQYSIKVWVRGECSVISCSSDESIADEVENEKIKIKTSCRSGRYVMCHTRLISGEYYIPKNMNGRRAAYEKFGWIHPCQTYHLLDMEIEFFPKK